MDEDIIVSKEYVTRLWKDNKRYKDNAQAAIFTSIFLIIVILVLCMFLIMVNSDKKVNLTNIDNRDATIEQLKEEVKDLNKQLKVRDQNIFDLKERITYLSFSQAMYEPSNDVLGAQAEAEKEITVNEWWKNIDLFTIGQEVPLPDCDTNTFRCMDYHMIVDPTTWQYKIQQKSETDNNGLRYYQYAGSKYYTVALATAYGIDLGNAYRVELENGVTFNIVHADYKHDITKPSPTDYGDKDRNYNQEDCINVIEFIYVPELAAQNLIEAGEANECLGEGCSIYGDGCNIKSMTYIGEIWTAN